MTALLAATGAGVMRAQADDGSWSVLCTLPDEDVRCLCARGTTVFAGTDRGGVFRSVDGGWSWTRAGLSAQRVRSLAAGGTAVYAGTREPGVHISVDGGDSWRRLAGFRRLRSWWWLQPAERPYRPSYLSALAVTGGGTLLAGIEACAVLRSDDSGRSWSGHRRRALRDCHELHVFGGRIYEAGAGGAAVSSDDGRSWVRLRDGLDRRYGWSMAIAEEALYLTAAPYRAAHSGDSRACIYRARHDGPWERCTDELSSLPRLRATAGGDLFAALADGSVLHTADEGKRWQRLSVDLGQASRALLALE